MQLVALVPMLMLPFAQGAHTRLLEPVGGVISNSPAMQSRTGRQSRSSVGVGGAASYSPAVQAVIGAQVRSLVGGVGGSSSYSSASQVVSGEHSRSRLAVGDCDSHCMPVQAAAQGVHMAALMLLVKLIVHGVQTRSCAGPAGGLAATEVPAGQSLKAVHDAAFMVALNVPAPHGEHVRSRIEVPVSATCCPGPQFVHGMHTGLLIMVL
jgi:hypothetical protein